MPVVCTESIRRGGRTRLENSWNLLGRIGTSLFAERDAVAARGEAKGRPTRQKGMAITGKRGISIVAETSFCTMGEPLSSAGERDALSQTRVQMPKKGRGRGSLEGRGT